MNKKKYRDIKKIEIDRKLFNEFYKEADIQNNIEEKRR